ncbi:hypothetical protein [Neglectibacter timonensis]|uniref:hypothetical protein n=1 Tax=Neglectibacter timonensis TaxID=1776382 RepID=UPI003219ECD6
MPEGFFQKMAERKRGHLFPSGLYLHFLPPFSSLFSKRKDSPGGEPRQIKQTAQKRALVGKIKF